MRRMTRLGLAICIAVFFLASACKNGIFAELMAGKDGSAWAGDLAVSPATATLVCGESLTFAVSGGDGSYSFSLVGSGSFDKATMSYTAPAAEGTDRLFVTDGAGSSVEAVLAIKKATSPDYRVALSPAPLFPDSGLTGGGAFSGSFSIENISGEAGSDPIAWKVYVSRDAALDALDLVAASGSQSALAASSVSSSIAFSGAWPAAADGYYLIIALAAGDDANAANDSSISAEIAITGASRPDYSITSVGAPSLGLSTVAFSQNLVISNIGPGAGSEDATWTVYLSTDSTYDDTDTEIDSGLVASDLAAGGSDTQTFSGSFPSSPGTYYFVAKVSAFDDATTGSKTVASAPITVSGPDYDVTALTIPTGSQTAGQALSGSLTIRNGGSVAGLRALSWSIYASLGDAAFDAGDALIASGTTSALASGASVSPSYSGTWPSTAGSYYLIARAQAADDATIGELASAALTVARPDYNVTAVAAPTGMTAGQALSGSFTIRNSGLGLGVSAVSWWVYASLGNTAFDAGDALIASGTTSALASGASVSPSYSGTWPSTAGSYYLIARAQAADDATIGELASSAIAVAGPSYTLSELSAPTAGGTGLLASGSFAIANAAGSGNGTSALYWSVYASLANATIDAGDSLIASGSTSALAAGASVSQSYSGTWPTTAGSYYLIARAQAADDATIGELASSAIAVAGPSYALSELSAPTAGGTGLSTSGSFAIANAAGSGNGASALYWSVYASLANATIDAGDSLIASGSTSALAAGASVSQSYSGTWPTAAGSYYLIARAQAADDATIGELASSAIAVAGPDYAASSVVSPTVLVAGSAFSSAFTIVNGGSGAGSSSIAWTAYYSTTNSLGSGAVFVASSQSTALASGGSASPTYGGTWPTTSGSYYLIVTVQASDDANAANDSAASAELIVGP